MGTSFSHKSNIFKATSGMVIAKLLFKRRKKMKKVFSSGLIALALIFGIIATTSTTADAQWRNRSNSGYNNQQIQQGFQYGVNTGANDAQRRQSYSPQRSRYYRDASTQAFREGFVRGYDQGYRQYAESYGDGRYRNNGSYGNSGYNNQQLTRGYEQGLSTGATDGQRGQSYSPQRSRYYQNASTQAFREGFVRGYDEGYRQYRNGRRSNTGTSILDRIFGRP
jgi:hypothetical protein